MDELLTVLGVSLIGIVDDELVVVDHQEGFPDRCFLRLVSSYSEVERGAWRLTPLFGTAFPPLAMWLTNFQVFLTPISHRHTSKRRGGRRTRCRY